MHLKVIETIKNTKCILTDSLQYITIFYFITVEPLVAITSCKWPPLLSNMFSKILYQKFSSQITIIIWNLLYTASDHLSFS